jgi:toxin ParE1/3/4
MAKVLRTSLAEQDLFGIWTYVARDNVAAADRLLARIDEAFAMLLRNPELGERVDRFRPGLRAWSVVTYVIYYRPIDEGIEIYRVLHSARKAEDLL